MTWLRQAVHVAAKDARMAWYLFAAMVPLVLAQAFQVAGTFEPLWSMLLGLLTVIFVAYVVQADAAVRGEAFWVTLPLSPGAVFAGKLLCAAGVLLLVLAGEAIMLGRHDATAAVVSAQMVALVRSEGQLLCIAVLIATLTRDLRSFAIVLVLGALVWFFGAGVIALRFIGRQPAGPPPWVWPVLGAVGSLVIAGYQYRSGRRLRAALTAAVFLGVVLTLGATFQPNPFTALASRVPLPRDLRPDSVVAARLVSTPGGEPDRNVSAHLAGGSRQLEYVLTAAFLEVRRRDGSVSTVPMFPPTRLSGDSAVPEVPGSRWVNLPPARSPYFWTGLSGFGEQGQRAGEALRLYGEIQAAMPWVSARFPLRDGAVLAQAGRRIHIIHAAIENGDVSVDLEVSSVVEQGPSFRPPERLVYALLDRAHGIVFPLAVGRSSGGSSSLFAGGTRVTSEHLQLAPFGKAQPVGTGPFELLVIDWRVLGSYHVSLPVGVRMREYPPGARPAAAMRLGPQDPGAMRATVAPTPQD